MVVNRKKYHRQKAKISMEDIQNCSSLVPHYDFEVIKKFKAPLPSIKAPFIVNGTSRFYKLSCITVSLVLKVGLVLSQAIVIDQNDYSILVEPCKAGQYLDQTTGCQNCPEDQWSAADNKLTTCTACPSGKGVASGSGTSESACTWSKSI